MSTEPHQQSNAVILKTAMAEIFRGRAFSIEEAGAVLTAQDAFDPAGFLPLFAARAAKRFRYLHGEGIPISRCMACGLDRPQENVCDAGCPLKRGMRRLPFPFRFDIRSDPSALTGTVVNIDPYRNSLFVALFLIQDVAIELAQNSPDPRLISVQPLIAELTAEIAPLLAAVEQPMTPSPERLGPTSLESPESAPPASVAAPRRSPGPNAEARP